MIDAAGRFRNDVIPGRVLGILPLVGLSLLADLLAPKLNSLAIF